VNQNRKTGPPNW